MRGGARRRYSSVHGLYTERLHTSPRLTLTHIWTTGKPHLPETAVLLDSVAQRRLVLVSGAQQYFARRAAEALWLGITGHCDLASLVQITSLTARRQGPSRGERNEAKPVSARNLGRGS